MSAPISQAPSRADAAARVILASSNPGKLGEIQAILADFDVNVNPQSAFDIPDVAETGSTFVENAILKARNAASLAGLPAIADDSGIEVDALGGAPGVRSARYAGEGSTDEDNLAKLLTDMQDFPDSERAARFHCVLAYLDHPADPTPIVCQGVWSGRLLYAPRGRNGFGYDPIFYVPTHNCSSAELPSEEKNRISHRGQAVRELVIRLRARFNRDPDR